MEADESINLLAKVFLNYAVVHFIL